MLQGSGVFRDCPGSSWQAGEFFIHGLLAVM
jgi:hypothetical protein